MLYTGSAMSLFDEDKLPFAVLMMARYLQVCDISSHDGMPVICLYAIRFQKVVRGQGSFGYHLRLGHHHHHHHHHQSEDWKRLLSFITKTNYLGTLVISPCELPAAR